MTAPFAPRYFLASVVLLAALVALIAGTGALRTRQELTRQLEDKGRALADTLEASSRNAIRANALMEDMIGQRLLDNARLLDRLVAFRPPDPAWLRSLAEMTRRARIDLLDEEGHAYRWPDPPPAPPGHPGMMRPGMLMRHRRMMEARPHGPPGSPEEGTPDMPRPPRPMAMYMWGRRWAVPRAEEGAPPRIQDRRFWAGTVFGVAVGARSFPGIIAVHADADYVLNFGSEIGVQRQVEELGRQSGVAAVAILDPDLRVIAHTDPARIGSRETSAELAAVLTEGRALARLGGGAGGPRVYEVARPLALGGPRMALLRIVLAADSMDRVWQRDRLAAVLAALAVLGLGAVGLAVIFYTQHRHLGELRRLETEVARRGQLATLGNMAAAVGHEIRNPLNAVSMGLQRLRAEFEPGGTPAETADYRRLVDLVQGEVRRLNDIVEEFLSLARPQPLRLGSVRVSELIAEAAALIEGQARAAGIRLERAGPPELPPVQGDRDRLQQVLLNLLLNAVQAMPDGGTLAIAATADRQAVTLSVSDSGPGMPPEVLERVFEPYYTTKAKGLGLGLAIARQIIEAHGGTIAVESVAGQGTRFTVALPLDGRSGG